MLPERYLLVAITAPLCPERQLLEAFVEAAYAPAVPATVQGIRTLCTVHSSTRWKCAVLSSTRRVRINTSTPPA
jgi:hypothetical protein